MKSLLTRWLAATLFLSPLFVSATPEAVQNLSHLPARSAPEWVRHAVVYEIFPRQFSASGDFAGVTAKLDELKELGVDVLWLMPIHPIGEVKRKGSVGSPYAVRDYYGIDPNLGTTSDLRKLVSEAHARGQKVIIDIVANHTAWDNVMMDDSSHYVRDTKGDILSPYDWTDVAELNYDEPKTRSYMREMLKYWVREFDLDGFRCDVAGEVPTDFWESVREDLQAIKPDIFLLAEASKPDLLVKAFDADYAWPMLQTLNKVVMHGAPASDIRTTWQTKEQAVFPAGALHLRMSDNHDEPRAISRFGLGGALAASALMFTLDGVPLLYNGMEVGDTAESGAPALFEKVPIFWQPKDRPHFRDTYRALISLRRSHAALRKGTVVWLQNTAETNVVSFARRLGADELVIVINFSNRLQPVQVQVDAAESLTCVLSSSKEPAGHPGKLELSAFEWRVYRR